MLSRASIKRRQEPDPAQAIQLGAKGIIKHICTLKRFLLLVSRMDWRHAGEEGERVNAGGQLESCCGSPGKSWLWIGRN